MTRKLGAQKFISFLAYHGVHVSVIYTFYRVTRVRNGRKEIIYLTMHSTIIWKEGTVLLNKSLNTFYLRLYGIGHMVKDHSDSEKGNQLPHGLLFLINSKGSFICSIPQTG